MNMNEHVLHGTVVCCLSRMSLIEVTHGIWGDKEPPMYIGGMEPINGVWHNP